MNMKTDFLSRRSFLQSTTMFGLVGAFAFSHPQTALARAIATAHGTLPTDKSPPVSREALHMLREFDYDQVTLHEGKHQSQFESTIATLMAISDDTMLQPFRVRAGQSAPGVSLGGWYEENPAYDWKKGGDSVGFAPGHCFGQWLSALSRAYAITKSPAIGAKVERLMHGYDATICEKFYDNFRFPSYTYDKLVCGLLDAYELVGLKDAMPILQRTTDAALPNLPPRALERGEPIPAHPDRDDSFRWDESYTLPENLFRAYELGAGDRYRELAIRFLLDKPFFDPLSRGENALVGRHAYSFMNALSSSMRAYMVMGSEKHFAAGKNAFDMIQAQSFASGGWGPDETFAKPGAGTLGKSLQSTHQSFETCGGYAHMKLTRYLLRATRDVRYGDSMESVISNTVLGVLPMKTDGSAFYYSDYNFNGRKVYYRMKCPCCAGTLPQIVADYRLCTYFQDAEGPIVNLYIPSTLRWKQHGAEVSLTQSGDYPFDGRIKFRVETSKSTSFSLRFRIPLWAGDDARVTVNGRASRPSAKPGTFATVRRRWKNGDVVALNIPMSTRLQAIDAEHPDTVALSYGPLSLFAVKTGSGELSSFTREQLLAAKRSTTRNDEWLVDAPNGPLRFLPFTSIGDEEYSAYLSVKAST